jgi:hypothetical protein
MAAFEKTSLVCWIGNSPVVYGYSLHTNVVSNLKLEYGNVESYLDPYPLQTQGHQCPQNYDVNTLFKPQTIEEEFVKLLSLEG